MLVLWCHCAVAAAAPPLPGARDRFPSNLRENAESPPDDVREALGNASEQAHAVPAQQLPQAPRARSPVNLSAQIQVESTGYSRSTHIATALFLRRAQIGVSANLTRRMSFNFSYNFAGEGPQGTQHLRSAYFRYQTGPHVAIQAGAYPPALGLSADGSDTSSLFAYRDSATDIARGIGSGYGRKAISVIYRRDRTYAVASLSEKRLSASPTTADQWALLGRISHLLIDQPHAKLLMSLGGTVSQRRPRSGSMSTITFSDGPESNANGLENITSGPINASRVHQWNFETAAQLRGLYAQAGYVGFVVRDRSDGLKEGEAESRQFGGGYAQLGWVLTGEIRRITQAHTFDSPQPSNPKSMGIGAIELAARYSEIGLPQAFSRSANSLAKQRILSGGLNWYPTRSLRLSIYAQDISTRKLSSAGIMTRVKGSAVTFLSLWSL